jgi:glutamate-5-semialdehyde dehydrogenase
MDMIELAKSARHAAGKLSTITTDEKNVLLRKIADQLVQDRDIVLGSNLRDLQKARVEVDAGRLSASLFRRLDLQGDKYTTMVQGVLDIISLPDPIGTVTLATQLDHDLELYRVTAPIGVLLVIFEARPEVVVNVAALALKSSNAVILKGGKEAKYTNKALCNVLQAALGHIGDAVQLVESREDITSLLELDTYVDMVIPRGSNALVRFIQNNTRIPVLGHADGLCSVYVDKLVDVDKAVRVVVDAKTNYPAACNAAETLLVHRDVLLDGGKVLKAIAQALWDKGVMLHADPECLAILTSCEHPPTLLVESKEVDYDTEFLDLEMAVKAVDSLDVAIDWVTVHGSKHTDVILTEDVNAAEQWMQRIDAAGVYWNASSRFADGFRYGFGAEIGVSTNKTHARGPVGLQGLVIYKYRLYGNGHTAGDFQNKAYLHTPIPHDKAHPSLANSSFHT